MLVSKKASSLGTRLPRHLVGAVHQCATWTVEGLIGTAVPARSSAVPLVPLSRSLSLCLSAVVLALLSSLRLVAASRGSLAQRSYYRLRPPPGAFRVFCDDYALLRYPTSLLLLCCFGYRRCRVRVLAARSSHAIANHSEVSSPSPHVPRSPLRLRRVLHARWRCTSHSLARPPRCLLPPASGSDRRPRHPASSHF